MLIGHADLHHHIGTIVSIIGNFIALITGFADHSIIGIVLASRGVGSMVGSAGYGVATFYKIPYVAPPVGPAVSPAVGRTAGAPAAAHRLSLELHETARAGCLLP